MKVRKVVPVFGAYFNGNFGDDLMGHLLANRLEEAGYEPLLWRGSNHKIEGKSWKVANTAYEFLTNAKCVVFGGGMVFCNSNFREYWSGMGEILEICEERNIPIIAVSVGSDGHFENLHPVAERLLASPMFKAVSLRLESDVAHITSVAKNTCINRFFDIVLTSSSLKERTRISKVLVCLPVGRLERCLLRISFFLMTCKGMEVRSIAQFVDGSPEAKSFMRIPGRHLSNQGVDSLMDAVRESDVVVGRGLHVGMAGMASGAAFISYKGSGKTSTFLQELNLSHNYINTSAPFLKPFLFLKLLSWLRPSLLQVDPALRAARENAEGHYKFMLDQLAAIDGG